MKKKIMLTLTTLVVVVMTCVALVACAPKNPAEFLEAAAKAKSVKNVLVVTVGDVKTETTTIITADKTYTKTIVTKGEESTATMSYMYKTEDGVETYDFDGKEWSYFLAPVGGSTGETEEGTVGDGVVIMLKGLLGDDMSIYTKNEAGYWVGTGIHALTKFKLDGKSLILGDENNSNTITLGAKMPGLPGGAKEAKKNATK